MQPEGKSYQAIIDGRSFLFETGRLAGQAGGAVTIQLGDTMVFAAATMSDTVRTGIDFFPLTVDYEERMYAGGRIPGSFFRREGRPTEEAILTARLTDRPIRPLFPKDMRNDVQVIIYSFSVDSENPIDILAINAASTALMISDIPFGGPIAAVRVAQVEGEFISNPTFEQLEKSVMDLRLAGTRDAILMVECGASEIPEAMMVGALEFGHKALQPLIDLQERMAAEVGKPKRPYQSFKLDEELVASVFARAEAPLNALFDKPYEKASRYQGIDEIKATLLAELAGEDATLAGQVKEAFEDALKKVVRARIMRTRRPHRMVAA